MKPLKFEIPGQTPSKKNSQQLFIRGGKPCTVTSKGHKAWYKKAKSTLELQGLVVKQELKKLKFPVVFQMQFFRKFRKNSKSFVQPFDYINLAQSVQDLFVDCGIIPDDSMNYIIPVFLLWAADSKAPRCEVEIKEV